MWKALHIIKNASPIQFDKFIKKQKNNTLGCGKGCLTISKVIFCLLNKIKTLNKL